ncbi:MAG TPA: hypothetical protein DEA27_04530 [Candidatus Moranbacteria bacterium]|nr:hypothetical protein [Candidatus Moranbacteria bacterium]
MSFFISGTINPKCNYVFFCVENKKTAQMIPKNEFGNPVKTNNVSAECFLQNCCSLGIESYSITDIKER